MNALLLLPLLLPGAEPAPKDAPRPVPATRVQIKDMLEKQKEARPRLPLPPRSDEKSTRVNNGRFREYYLPKDLRGGSFGRQRDPSMSMDPTFMVKLFWVTSRVNNCAYCLGHQEQKLAAAGLSDDAIALLDGDWEAFTPAEQAALRFTRRLTQQPHLAEVAELSPHYTPLQQAEIVLTVAGYNGTNRWTDGLNLPAEPDGNFFRKDAKVDLKTFRTPTSPRFAEQISRVAPLPAECKTASAPFVPSRPALESSERVQAIWQAARERKAALPLAEESAAKELYSEGQVPNWVRLLAVFPVAGKGRVESILAAQKGGTLSPRLKAQLAWAAAREDRAWYALDIARRRLLAEGLTEAQIWALDAEKNDLSKQEQAALALARKLTVAPATVTDGDVEKLRGFYKDTEVAQIVHQICTAAFFNRVTEMARLPLEP